LHSYALGMNDAMGLSERDIALSIVPMFHANAWGLPFACVLFGTTQVLPGPGFAPGMLLDLIESEKVTLTPGVPTIWMGVLKELAVHPRNIDALSAISSGGSALAKGLIRAYEKDYDVRLVGGYGMTETSPLVSLAGSSSGMADMTMDERIDRRAMAGLPMPGVE